MSEQNTYQVIISVYDAAGDFEVSNLTLEIDATISNSCSSLEEEIENMLLESQVLGGIPDWGVKEVVGVSTATSVNKLELADKIATRIMDDRYIPSGKEWMEENPGDPALFRIKPDVEDEFYDLYDEALKMISNSVEGPKEDSEKNIYEKSVLANFPMFMTNATQKEFEEVWGKRIGKHLYSKYRNAGLRKFFWDISPHNLAKLEKHLKTFDYFHKKPINQ